MRKVLINTSIKNRRETAEKFWSSVRYLRENGLILGKDDMDNYVVDTIEDSDNEEYEVFTIDEYFNVIN